MELSCMYPIEFPLVYIYIYIYIYISRQYCHLIALGVAVLPWATETVLSPWLAADEDRVSHVLSHVVWWIYIYIYITTNPRNPTNKTKKNLELLELILKIATMFWKIFF